MKGTLLAIKAEGAIRSVGVANYTIADYGELADSAGLQDWWEPPAVNQIEMNPFLFRKQTVDFFQGAGVHVQGYRTLKQGGAEALSDPTVLAASNKFQRTASQVLGRWCVQHGVSVVTKSARKERMRENAQIFDFELDTASMSELDSLTTPEAITDFQTLYEKCIVRDTPLAAP